MRSFLGPSYQHHHHVAVLRRSVRDVGFFVKQKLCRNKSYVVDSLEEIIKPFCKAQNIGEQVGVIYSVYKVRNLSA